MRALSFSVALLLISVSARAQFSSTTLRGIDVYRSEQVTTDQLKQKLGSMLSDYARLRYENHKNREKERARLHDQLESSVRAMGKFAFVKLYYGEYITSAERTVYLTFDLVDAKDAAQRMPFHAPPIGTPTDPGGLITSWQQYDVLGTSLMNQGNLSVIERPECPGFFCKWGSSTPELAALERKLADGAEKNKAALTKAAKEDADPARRSSALCALSYVQDGGEAARVAADGLSDPSADVREAALGILSDIAIYHKTVVVDISRVVAALDFPTVSERGKALGLLVALADTDAYKSFLTTRATPKLMPLLRLDQPANHDSAFTLLSVLSQQPFGQHDYDAWEDWAQKAASAPPAQDTKKHGR